MVQPPFNKIIRKITLLVFIFILFQIFVCWNVNNITIVSMKIF